MLNSPEETKMSNIAAQLEMNIDPCGWETVLHHFEHPDDEITQVVLVRDKDDLAEVGAVLVEGTEEEFHHLLKSGKVKVAVPTLSNVRPEYQKYSTLMNTIPRTQMCYVLFLPPVYVVHVTERIWE